MPLILSCWMLYPAGPKTTCMQQLKQFTKHNDMWNATNITRVNRARTCCQSRNAISCWRLTVCEVKSTCLRFQLSSASRLMLFPNLAYNWTFKSPRTPCMDDTRPSRALISSCRASCGDQNISMEMLSATTRFQNKHSASEKLKYKSVLQSKEH